jgi:hypothetical protein
MKESSILWKILKRVGKTAYLHGDTGDSSQSKKTQKKKFIMICASCGGRGVLEERMR